MTHCCNLPTYDFRNTTYNPTQVRLYGIPRDGVLAAAGAPAEFRTGDTVISVAPTHEAAELFHQRTGDDKMLETLKADAQREVDGADRPDFHGVLPKVPWPLPKVPVNYTFALPIDTATVGLAWLLTSNSISSDPPLSPGIIYAYAYEGHCYELPKPKIMLIPQLPGPIPEDDCCYASKKDYMVWIVDKLDSCVEIEMNQGFIEEIVLSANLPGKRSPSTYRANMAMAHRGGKLSE